MSIDRASEDELSDASVPERVLGYLVANRDRAFKGAGAARPRLVISNHEGRPFHGDQYITLTLTTRTWPGGLSSIPEADWIRGGVPPRSYVVPWGVQSLDRDDVEHWQGRLDQRLVDEAIRALTDYLG
ncbi:type II toxin-antitoxin system PemK/MazF family toxin [Halorarum salinum]|uniref:Type II toxin-antitoxin system PemK/MazF family toxin n=1 Tax=Halorarum salinum TaxID=2743089 RepID=A0A7D5LDP3_9EURY|nr:type II toxin-antitoxin system PemK/MazF family toxin [Halobaculum salinum]QLG64251.1 type II toxin-antitoxin system PemK/MazF family toxin [Halobaculum salinum]